MRPTISVTPTIYADSTARNWLAVRDCRLSPTSLGGLEIVFASQQEKLEFCLRFGQYAITATDTQ